MKSLSLKSCFLFLIFIYLQFSGFNQTQSDILNSDSISSNQTHNHVITLAPAILRAQKINWKEIEIPTTHDQRNQFINLSIGNEYFSADEEESNNEEYHIVDFTQDGLPDMIYAGRNPPGGEIDNMAFFENDGDSLRLILKLIGTITELSLKNLNSTANLVVWKWPCCAEYMNTLTYYSFTKSDTNFYFENYRHEYLASYGIYAKNYHPNFLKIDKYTFVSKTIFPEKINLSDQQKCIIIQDSSYLTSNPNLEFENPILKSFVVPHVYQFNILIAQIPVNTQATILFNHSFNNELYYLLKLNLNNTNSKLEYIKNQDVEGLLGWVKASDVLIQQD